MSKGDEATCEALCDYNNQLASDSVRVRAVDEAFDNIQNDRNSVFIVVSDNTLMRIGSVTTYNSILLAGKLGWMIRINVAINLLLLHLHVFLLLLYCHDKTSICD